MTRLEKNERNEKSVSERDRLKEKREVTEEWFKQMRSKQKHV